MELLGTYAGTVESVEDPEKIGRLKVRVPAVYGPAGTKENSIATSDLPWALPTGMPAGGTSSSGAFMWLPGIGDHVFVRFLDGVPEKPIWEWGGQDRQQKKVFPFWQQYPGAYTDAATPDTTALLRHGHAIEISPGGVMATTSYGYALVLTDAGDQGFGLAQLLTAKGYQLTFDDNKDQLTVYAPTIQALFELVVFTGARFVVTASEIIRLSTSQFIADAAQTKLTTTTNTALTAGTEITAAAPRVALGTVETQDSVVRLSDLVALANAIMAIFNAHLHTGNLGRPTSPPTQPMQLHPTGSQITFSA